MRFGDTTLGGAGGSFPSTHWSEVQAAQDPSQPGYRDRLDALVRTYWKPAYAYIRASWKKSNEDAKDLTQAFFAHLLQNGRIAPPRKEGGRFRSYLKQALKNFLIDAHRSAEVRKAIQPAAVLEAHAVSVHPDPDRAFDREWLSCLLESALSSLEADLKKEGKGVYFEVFRTYLLDPAEGREVTVATQSGEIVLPTYQTVGRRLGVRESDVRNYLTQCRTRLREILRTEIRQTLEDADEAEDELRSLLAV
jgi:RNA polymerase sigma-70 factor (ECF subfamily)